MLDMLLFLFSIIFATAAGVTAFLLLSSGNVKVFKQRFLAQPETKQLPIVTPDGNLVDTKEELEAHLEVLESKLMEKADELETSKTRVNDAKVSIDRLHSTQVQVKKYYIKLKEEIKKSEEDCKSLQSQIDDYRSRRVELEKEMKKNEEYYENLLKAVKSDDSANSSQASSKESLHSEHSSTGSYYDSVQNNGESATKFSKGKSAQGSKQVKLNGSTPSKDSISKSKKPKKALHSTPVSRVGSKNALFEQKRLSQTVLKIPSEVSLDCQNQISRESSRNEVPSQGSKSPMTPTKLVSSFPKGPKPSKTKPPLKIDICCCGSANCTGTCNLARCIKLGFLKPKDILSVGLAEHVDVMTEKVICEKSCALKFKALDAQLKRPLTTKNVNRFS